ncbi:MAG: beta-lactamase family protein [Gemmatimonadota bacterium]|nr:MAG: beta-lactamase family protein [Gemmatimonadota bacterium]
MKRFCLAALLSVTLAVSTAAAQENAALIQRLDSIAGHWVGRNYAVGLVAAVVQDNDTLLFKSYGKADVEWDVPMPLDAMFVIGSVTKQFTAVAVLQLRDEGKLSLDDAITRWLPALDTHGHAVTLRHLLAHTAGIADFTEAPEFGSLSTNIHFQRDSAYALLQRLPPQFAPGAIQVYNNSGFWLLGLVIEKASGMTYEDYIEEKIFAPLAMTRSMYCNSLENVPRRAHGYFVSRDSVIRRAWTIVHTWPFAAGSLCSTVGDMVTWLQALHGGRVLAPESYAEYMTPSSLNDGTPLRYSMGLQIGPDPSGLMYIGHGGRSPGFWVEAGWYPEAELAVVVMINNVGPLDPQEVVTELADEVLGWTPPPPKRFAGDPAPLVGRYLGQGRGEEMVVEVTQTPRGPDFSINGARPRAIPWIEGLTFGRGLPRLIFRRANGDSGPVTELRFSMPGAHFILSKQ